VRERALRLRGDLIISTYLNRFQNPGKQGILFCLPQIFWLGADAEVAACRVALTIDDVPQAIDVIDLAQIGSSPWPGF
jgi:hypothetical protein